MNLQLRCCRQQFPAVLLALLALRTQGTMKKEVVQLLPHWFEKHWGFISLLSKIFDVNSEM